MPRKRTFRESFHHTPPWEQNSLKNADIVIPILDEDNIEYHPEDSLSLLGIDRNEVRDMSSFHGNANSTDGYPFSPVIETIFGCGLFSERKKINVVNEQSTKVPVSASSPDNFGTMTQSSLNEVNLDDVPMDIVTSDAENEEHVDASPPNYTTLISEVLNSSLFNVHRNDNSTDLDEMELRSRALRSLLLKRRSPTKDNEQSVPISSKTVGTNISVSTATLVTKTLSIGSGKQFSQGGTQNRFIITIADTSDSDSSEESPFSNSPVPEPDNPCAILGAGSSPKTSGTSSTTSTASVIPTITTVATIASTFVTVTPATHSSTTAVANNATTSTNATPVLITNLANQSNEKKSPASEQAQRRLLQRKMELLRMTLTVKRQQRIVDERRQLMNNLFKTLTELRMRVRTTRKLYKQTYESLQQAAGAQHCYRRKLLSAQREYAQACNALKLKDANVRSNEVRKVPIEPVKKTLPDLVKKVPGEPVKRKLISVAPSEPVALLRSRLMTRFMQILENVKVTTPYFNYYRFDLPLLSDPVSRNSCIPPTSKSETTSVLEESKIPSLSSSTVLNSVIRVDPNVPLCPFSLDGECKDAECALQHPSTAPKKAPIVPVSASLEIKTVNPIPPAQSSVAEDKSSCPVCKKPLLPNTVDNNQPMLRRWHALYLTYKCSVERGVSADFSKVCSTSLDLIRQSANNPELVDHHLELLYSQPTGTMTRDIVQCLKVSDYSMAACKSVFRNPLLSGMVRRLLARSALEDLVPRLNKPPHTEDPTSALSTSFVYLAYHLSWLLAEAGNMESAYSHLDKLLTYVRKKHPVRYGLWWLKLSMTLGKRIPNEDTLFSLVNLPNYTRPVIAQHQALIQEAVVDLEIPQTAEAQRSVIEGPCALHTCYLALLYMHVQTLIVNQQHQTAGEICLRFSTLDSLQEFDDLFYPTAIYALYASDASLDWPSLLKHAPESARSTLTISFRIEFSFLLANLACRKKSLDLARSLLLESLAGLTFLPSDVDSEVLKTFEELLGANTPECEPVVLSELLSLRGRTYLWLSYCLYSLLCSSNTMVPLNHLIEYFQKQPSSEKDRTAFDRLLLHMIIVLANSLPTSTITANYSSYVNPVLFDRPLSLDRHVMPSWFIEVMQRINWAQLPSSGMRQDLCVRLVETYGTQLVPSFCRTLFAMGDPFLAQSLCAIGRIDKPRREDFWVIYAALLLSESGKSVTPITSRQRIVKLQELFSDAIAAVPSSLALWQYYALTIKATGTSTALLLKCAGEFGMLDAVSEIVKEPNNSVANSTPRRVPLPSVVTPHSTPQSGKKRKKSSKKKRRYFIRASKRLNTSGT